MYRYRYRYTERYENMDMDVYIHNRQLVHLQALCSCHHLHDDQLGVALLVGRYLHTRSQANTPSNRVNPRSL